MNLLGFTFITIAIIIVGGIMAYNHFRVGRLDTLNLKLLIIKIAKRKDELGTNRNEQIDFTKEVALTEQIFSALTSVKQPVVFETSVHRIGEDIFFYIAVPEAYVEFASRQIQGLFPDSQVVETADYNIFEPNGATVGAYFTQKQSYVAPIRTYKEAQVDTFAPILSNFSKLADVSEGVSLQIIFQPAHKRARKKIMDAIRNLKQGEKFSRVMKKQFITTKELYKVLKPTTNTKKEKREETYRVTDDDAIKALQEKVSKPLFAVNVRVLASATDMARAESILNSVIASFSQFSSPVRNELVPVRPKNLKRLIYEYSFREYDGGQTMILSSEELASIFHLPTSSTDIPRIKWLTSREAPPPESLPDAGIIIGESVYRDEHKNVRMTDDDRRRHLYIIGQTGTGKTLTMKHMVAQDIVNGKGFCLIDPNTDFFNDMLALVPKERIDDVIIFDPSDIARPLGLNMLEYDLDNPEQKSFVVSEIQSIFDRLFDAQSMGPMFQQYMRNALLLLMEDAVNEPCTLVEVPRIFTDEAFRKRKLARVKNPTVIDFWEREATKTSGEHSLANMTVWITSKFGNFLSNDFVRPIIGQPKSAFNFRKLMDEGKMLFINLPKAKIGELNANLLGMIIVGKLMMAAFGRSDIINQEDRRDFYLYIDEFQNFTTDSIATILSEARKYRLDMIIAHQFVAQMPEKIRDAVFGNVGSVIACRVGVPDTEVLGKQFDPIFTAKDLISIENKFAHVKMLINGQPSRPFTMHLLPPPPGNAEVREKLKELSRLVYGKDLEDVEADILARLRL
ncbi:MAG: type IV secretion system DNA-binding domain-containing protein [Candidatus Paceibacterota bacterium]|jgi:hypothetical protein